MRGSKSLSDRPQAHYKIIVDHFLSSSTQEQAAVINQLQFDYRNVNYNSFLADEKSFEKRKISSPSSSVLSYTSSKVWLLSGKLLTFYTWCQNKRIKRLSAEYTVLRVLRDNVKTY